MRKNISSSTKIVTVLGIASTFSIVSVPLGSSSAATADTNVTVAVDPVLSLTVSVPSGATDPSTSTSIASGGSNNAKQNAIQVSGNSNYKLTVQANSSNTYDNALATSSGNTIAAYTTDQSSLTNTGWGLMLTAAPAANHTSQLSNSVYRGVPSKSGTAKTVTQTSSTSPLFTNDTTTVRYGVKTATSQVAGSYSCKITYSLSSV